VAKKFFASFGTIDIVPTAAPALRASERERFEAGKTAAVDVKHDEDYGAGCFMPCRRRAS
jgi:hypothetical protein